jgi:hypothetical protein
MDAAAGAYLLFLDADDVLEPNAIARLVECALAAGGGAACGDWRDFTGSIETGTIMTSRPHYHHDAYASCVRGGLVNGCSLLARSECRWNERRSVWEALDYLLRCFAPGAALGYVDAVVVNVRQHDSPERFSARRNHFEPAMTGAFFAEQKALLARDGLLSFARAEALDQRIVANACVLVRGGRMAEAESLLAAVSWSQLARYDWYGAFSFAGAVHRLGPRLGGAAFHHLNHALGRL